MKRTLLERFLDKVSPEPHTGCWLWTGAMTEQGYGIFYPDPRKRRRASRVSWMLFHGEIPAGLFVCHRCDIRCCVNPDHLFLGTPQENQADMKRKGRSCFGEKNPLAKLSAEQVVEIKALLATGANRRSLARRFQVSRSTIHNIRRGETWRHLRQDRGEPGKESASAFEMPPRLSADADCLYLETTMADFKEAFTNTLRFEDPHLSGKVTVDAGGRTRFGIAARFHPDLPEEFFTGPAEEALAEAEKIEKAGYWDIMRLGEIHDQSVANKIFDMAVNMGVRQAAVLAQRAANGMLQDGCAIRLMEDGAIGARTLAAINALDPAGYVQTLRELSADLYRHIASVNPAQAVNLEGWLRRAGA